MKRVFVIGRWRVAVMWGHGPYRLGFHVKTLIGRRIGFAAGLRVCVINAIRRDP